MNQPMPMLDQSVTTSLTRPELVTMALEWGQLSQGEVTESLASLVHRFRPEIEALLKQPPDRASA